MYVGRLQINRSRIAVHWLANPYRVHQRLKMAFEGGERLLYRIEETPDGTQILIQSDVPPDWEAAFATFAVLGRSPEHKRFEPHLAEGRCHRFRLLANPIVTRQVDVEGGGHKGKRIGLLRNEDQQAWLQRKLEACGAVLEACTISPRGLQRSRRNPQKDDAVQTHLAVQFDGVLRVRDVDAVTAALEHGIGPAKAYGFGLLSLAAV